MTFRPKAKTEWGQKTHGEDVDTTEVQNLHPRLPFLPALLQPPAQQYGEQTPVKTNKHGISESWTLEGRQLKVCMTQTRIC